MNSLAVRYLTLCRPGTLVNCHRRAATTIAQKCPSSSSNSTSIPDTKKSDSDNKKEGHFKGPEEILHEAYVDGKIKDGGRDKPSKPSIPVKQPSTRNFSTSAINYEKMVGDTAGKARNQTANPDKQIVGGEGLESVSGGRSNQTDDCEKRAQNQDSQQLPKNSPYRSENRRNSMSQGSPTE